MVNIKQDQMIKLSEEASKQEHIYNEIIEEFKQKIINKINEVLNYYNETSKVSYITDFINEEKATLKNMARYKRILNNIIDNLGTMTNINLADEMFNEQTSLNNNIDFSYIVDKFEIELLRKLNLNEEIKKELIDVFKNNINVLQENIHELNANMIKQFKNMYNEFSNPNYDYKNILNSMPPDEAIKYLSDRLNSMSDDEAKNTIEMLLQSNIRPEIKEFLNNEKTKNKVI